MDKQKKVYHLFLYRDVGISILKILYESLNKILDCTFKINYSYANSHG